MKNAKYLLLEIENASYYPRDLFSEPEEPQELPEIYEDSKESIEFA